MIIAVWLITRKMLVKCFSKNRSPQIRNSVKWVCGIFKIYIYIYTVCSSLFQQQLIKMYCILIYNVCACATILSIRWQFNRNTTILSAPSSQQDMWPSLRGTGFQNEPSTIFTGVKRYIWLIQWEILPLSVPLPIYACSVQMRKSEEEEEEEKNVKSESVILSFGCVY